MGVPGLFFFISKNFDGVVTLTAKPKIRDNALKECDHLYFDTNALIHPCAQFIFNYGTKKRYNDPNAKKSIEERLEMLMDKVCETLSDLIDNFSPSKSVMIAVDGVAPFAKQTQQRQRRYLAAKVRTVTENASVSVSASTSTSTSVSVSTSASTSVSTSASTSVSTSVSTPPTFDSCCISPGTLFMFKLHKRLILLSKKLRETRGIEVVYSSYMTPGEGEHKLLDKIRERSCLENTKDDCHCIIGPDGDLLILCLCLPTENVFIGREDMQDSTLYNIVDIKKLKTSICKSAGIKDADIKDKNRENYLCEFLLVCSVFGNDFLPRIQMFTCLSQGLEYVLHKWNQIYKERSNDGGTHTTNIKILYSLFDVLAKDEERYLLDQALYFQGENEYEPKILRRHLIKDESPSPKVHTIYKRDQKDRQEKQEPRSSIYENNPSRLVDDEMRFKLDFENYRKSYYEKVGLVFTEGTTFEQSISMMCEKYVKTLLWIKMYYTEGVTSVSWHYQYPYFYAPMMSDLVKYTFSSDGESDVTLDIRSDYDHMFRDPVHPFLQLLFVVPPKSFELLPQKYRHIFSDIKNFPLDFETDFEGKTYEHEAIIKLTLPDVYEIQRKYLLVNSRLKKPFKRNAKKREYIFN